MKNKILSLVIGVVALTCIAAVTLGPIRSARDYKIDNGTDSVALTLQKGTLTSNFFEAYAGSTLKASINSNGVIYIPTAAQGPTRTNLGLPFSSTNLVQSGRGVSTADGTVTNTFSPVFSAVPKVMLTMFGTTYSETNAVQSVTTSNFIAQSKITGVTNDWTATGPP